MNDPTFPWFHLWEPITHKTVLNLSRCGLLVFHKEIVDSAGTGRPHWITRVDQKAQHYDLVGRERGTMVEVEKSKYDQPERRSPLSNSKRSRHGLIRLSVECLIHQIEVESRCLREGALVVALHLAEKLIAPCARL